MSNLAAIESTTMMFQQVIKELNNSIEEAGEVLFLSKSSQIQYRQCLNLDILHQKVSNFKKEAIYFKNENHANIFLGYECVIGAVKSELLMYLLLKQDKANSAWDRLVAAQIACVHAVRAHPGFAHCNERRNVLLHLEKELFSEQVFISAGFVSKRLDCSICGEHSSKCAHLKGKPYWGKFCEFIHRDPVGDHIALVEMPADKRCRVTSFKTAEGHRDKISSEITPYKNEEYFTESNKLEINAIFLVLDPHPYLSPTNKIIEFSQM